MNRRRFTTTAITLLACCSAVPALADSLSQLLLPILNLSGVEARDTGLPSLWEPPPPGGLAVRFRDEDLLRSYIDGVKVADLGTSQERVTLRIPLPGLRGQWLQVRSATASGDHALNSRDLDWAGRLPTTSAWHQLSWDLARDEHRIATAISWARERGRDETALLRFHSSTSDSRLNRYFWNLLEPTIGDQVGTAWNSRSLGVEAGWVTRLDRHRVGLQVQWSQVEPDAELSYVNTGSNPRLRGDREAGVEQRLAEGRVAVGIERRVSLATWLRAEVGYVARRFKSRASQRNVPQSDTGLLLDIVDLGRAEAEQRGQDMTLRASWRHGERLIAEGYIGLGRSRIEASGRGSTPVLGFSLRTLPITHGGNAALTGRLTSRAAGFDVHHRGSRSGIHLGGLLVRSEYRGRTEAHAQMGFGLFVMPVDRAAAYRLNLYRLSAAPWLRMGDVVEVEFEITQYTGGFRELGEAIQRQDEPAEFHGGRVHAVTVRYRL